MCEFLDKMMNILPQGSTRRKACFLAAEYDGCTQKCPYFCKSSMTILLVGDIPHYQPEMLLVDRKPETLVGKVVLAIPWSVEPILCTERSKTWVNYIYLWMLPS